MLRVLLSDLEPLNPNVLLQHNLRFTEKLKKIY